MRISLVTVFKDIFLIVPNRADPSATVVTPFAPQKQHPLLPIIPKSTILLPSWPKLIQIYYFASFFTQTNPNLLLLPSLYSWACLLSFTSIEENMGYLNFNFNPK